MVSTDHAHYRNDSVMFTVKEYSSIFGVHVQTVYTAIRLGRFRFKVVRPTERTIRIAIPREDIESLTPHKWAE